MQVSQNFCKDFHAAETSHQKKICGRFVYVIVVSAMLIKPMAVLRSGSKKPIFHWGLCDEPKGLERSRQNAEGVAAKKRAVRKAFIWTFLKDSLNFCWGSFVFLFQFANLMHQQRFMMN